MHSLVILCFLVAVALAAPVRLPKPHEKTQVGAHVVTPVRFPVQNVSVASFTVPHWLGLFVATDLINANADWSLPESYANGGDVMPGSMLMVRNYSSWTITLTPAAGEWIDGLPEYDIVPSEGAVFIAVDNGYIAVAELSF